MNAPFSRYVLRTTDTAGAATFYDAVLGHRGDAIFPLHESAVARGAPSHWLGHIRAVDLGGADAVGARFVERGATRLGPPPGTGDFVVLRDPGGAVVALTDNPADSTANVVWHQLNTREPAIAVANYGDLFGWVQTTENDLGDLGKHRRFAFAAGELAVGTISDVEGRPGVHTHWLFFFSVPSLDTAVDRVRELGGVVVGPVTLPGGARVAACDDPQGAAFGLVEPGDAAKLSHR